MDEVVNPFDVKPQQPVVQENVAEEAGNGAINDQVVQNIATEKALELEDDSDKIIDISDVPPNTLNGVSIAYVALTINVTLFVAMLVLSKCKKATPSTIPEIPVMIKMHTQRLATSNLIVGIILTFVTLWFEQYTTATRGKVCFNASEQTLLACAIFIFTVAAVMVRFAAFMFAESEFNKLTDGKDSEKKFDITHAEIFPNTMNRLVKVCILLVILTLITMFKLWPSFISSIFVDYAVCIPGTIQFTMTKLKFAIVMFTAVHLSIVVTEAIFKENLRWGLHIMAQLLDGPHVVTSLSIFGGSWILVLILLWYLGTFAVQCCILCMLYNTTDAFLTFVINISVPRSPQKTSIV